MVYSWVKVSNRKDRAYTNINVYFEATVCFMLKRNLLNSYGAENEIGGRVQHLTKISAFTLVLMTLEQALMCFFFTQQ